MTRRLPIVTALHPITTDDHEFMNNDHEFMIVDHDRITVAHEFITAHHETLPTSDDAMTLVHARMNGVTYFDADDHEWMTVAHEFVMIGSVRESFGSSQMSACNAAMRRGKSGCGSGRPRAEAAEVTFDLSVNAWPNDLGCAARRCTHGCAGVSSNQPRYV